ncbi:hypothetical protein [Prevotella ihumii]|uniref:hypothetical protein n=1 Tax=Prevotella ihumii TaxID=1917878 RepID=UPI000981F537|nr:hypothetical protein [Prevotella ihumii]
MKFKIFALSLCCLLTYGVAFAQTDATEMPRKNEFRIGYSDGQTLGKASFWGIGLGNAVSGTTRKKDEATGVFSVGYRYSINRLRIGIDLGLVTVTSTYDWQGSGSEDIRRTQSNFMVMPVGEFLYYKRGVVELYGSLATGIDITSTSEKGLTRRGIEYAVTKHVADVDFAFQVNPIALRIGNNHIGGFLEAGVGYRGFVTGGLSLRF